MDTRPVREGKPAGIAHLISGTLVVLWAARKLLSPGEASPYRPVESTFAYQYGGAILGLALGVAILIFGWMVFKKDTPAESSSTLVYIYEPEKFLGSVLGVPCTLFGVMCVVAVVPYTVERGVVPGQLAAAFFLVLFSFGCAWVFLHYRRTAVVDPETQRFEIRYGKPLVVKRSSFAFSEFTGVSIQVVPRRRVTVYRVVAGGEGKKPQLITFFFHESGAKQACAELARATGWHDLTS
jgi:hypothetical protein